MAVIASLRQEMLRYAVCARRLTPPMLLRWRGKSKSTMLLAASLWLITGIVGLLLSTSSSAWSVMPSLVGSFQKAAQKTGTRAMSMENGGELPRQTVQLGSEPAEKRSGLLQKCAAFGLSFAAFAASAVRQRLSKRAATQPKALSAASRTWEQRAHPQSVADEPLHVLVAGSGLGGAFLANALVRKGIKVTLLEKTRQFRKFGGPIQLASNALVVLRAVDPDLFKAVMRHFNVIGSRECGMKDGLRGEWYSKFEAIREIADDNNLPHSGVVRRDLLQDEFVESLQKHGADIVYDCQVVDYEELKGGGVRVTTVKGEHFSGDVLVAADGIWSKVRSKMWDEPLEGPASGIKYSGYGCFAGNCLLNTEDYFDVGYKVYVGPERFFVVCDVGSGRFQWYAFVARVAGEPEPEDMLDYLHNEFSCWCPEVHALLDATRTTGTVEMRDMHDRAPSLRSWSHGCVTMLGDAVHPMMPNLGQGGGMAMEDGYVLAELLGQVSGREQVPEVLQEFWQRRIFRTATVQGISRMASNMLNGIFSFPWKPVEWAGLVQHRVAGPDAPQSIAGWMDKAWSDFNDEERRATVARLLDPKGFFTAVCRPVIPHVFRWQFDFLYSFSREVKIPSDDSDLAKHFDRQQHIEDAYKSWNTLPNQGRPWSAAMEHSEKAIHPAH
eukprot:TRINITY_DN22119_c0_g2_i1.p1 TRINITY_DN22119_c0_g2~~TRINITY_DN22119_c0_g2_i1.p1  ORF type:complete len:666 (-),score=122.01 TRINITY_DN22119_c0_g2_i1:249-2246(-)